MPKICSHEAWFLREKCSHTWYVDFTTGQNRIFRPQKGRKLPHFSRCETLVSRIGKNPTIRYQNAENLLSRSLVHTENLLTRSLVLAEKLLPRNFWNVDFTTRQTRIFRAQKWRIFPLCARYLETLVLRIGSNRIFRLPKYRKFAHTKLATCVKFAHTKLGNLETWILRLGKIAFPGLKREENFYTLRGTLKRRFYESAKIEILDYQNVENFFTLAKNLLTRSLVPFNRGFHDSPKSHFRDSKIKKITSNFARYLETLISRIGRNCIFRLLKCRKFFHTKLGFAWLRLASLGFAWLRLAWLAFAWLRLTSLGLAWLR